LPEQDSDKANRLRDDFRNGVHELLAPDVLPIEVAHALTRASKWRSFADPASLPESGPAWWPAGTGERCLSSLGPALLAA
jgi:hypothetical protein